MDCHMLTVSSIFTQSKEIFFYPVVTLAAFLNCSKLDVLALRSRLFEAVDSASDPESRSGKEIILKN